VSCFDVNWCCAAYEQVFYCHLMKSCCFVSDNWRLDAQLLPKPLFFQARVWLAFEPYLPRMKWIRSFSSTHTRLMLACRNLDNKEQGNYTCFWEVDGNITP
jgi:hypothetical protein